MSPEVWISVHSGRKIRTGPFGGKIYVPISFRAAINTDLFFRGFFGITRHATGDGGQPANCAAIVIYSPYAVGEQHRSATRTSIGRLRRSKQTSEVAGHFWQKSTNNKSGKVGCLFHSVFSESHLHCNSCTLYADILAVLFEEILLWSLRMMNLV